MENSEIIAKRIMESVSGEPFEPIVIPSIEAISVLVSDDEKYFEKGDSDLWAAAVLYAIVQHNDMYSKESEFELDLSKVSKIFKVNKDGLSEKSGKIRKDLKLSGNDERFRIPDDESYLDILSEVVSMKEEFAEIIQAKVVLSLPNDSASKGFMDGKVKIIERIIEDFNFEEEEYDQIIINDLFASQDEIHLNVEGLDDDIDVLLDMLKDEGLLIESVEIKEEGIHPYLPDEHYYITMQQGAAMNLEDMSFETPEELNEYLRQFANKTIDEINSMTPANKKLEEEVEAMELFFTEKETSLIETKKFLKKSPDCVEAKICLAGWEKDVEKRISLLDDAIESGERRLKLETDDYEGRWWLDHQTRPYMRALFIQAMECIAADYKDDGLDILNDLLLKNPMDNQGVRYLLMEMGIVDKNWFLVKRLFKQFPDDGGIVFKYAKFIYYYYSFGKKSKTKKAIISAFNRNPYPFYLLVDEAEMPDARDTFRIGDKSEAVMVMDLFVYAMNKDVKLFKYCLDVLLPSGLWNPDSDDDDF